MVLATGCVKTGNDSDGDGAKIIVKVAGFSGDAQTRMVDAPGAQGNIVSPTNGRIYVIDGGAILHTEVLQVETASGQILADGRLFPETSKIYVLANMPSDINLPTTGGQWSDVESLVSSLKEVDKPAENYKGNDDYTMPAMGNSDVDGKGVGAPKEITVSVVGDTKVGNVTVYISPLFSRLELGGIKGGAHIRSFKVAGVYANNYYPSYNLKGEGSGNIFQFDQDNPLVGFHDVKDDLWISSQAAASAGVMTDNAKVNAVIGDNTTDSAWAYHVGSGSAATMIIKLAEIMIYDSSMVDGVEVIDYAGDGTAYENEQENDANVAYLVVSNYNNVSAFERGRIYQMDELMFDEKHLQDVVDLEGVTITATVNIVDWVPESLNPVLQD